MILIRTAATEVAFKQRQVDVVAVPFSQIITADDGEGPYREAFDSDVAVELLRDPVPALLHHNPLSPFGRVELRGRTSVGLVATMHAAKTPLGDEALELASASVLYPSVGFSGMTHRMRGGVMWRTGITLHEVSLVTFQAYPGATVTGVRSATAATPNLHAAQGRMNVLRNGRKTP